MRKLVNYGLDNYAYRNVWQDPPQLQVPVTDGVPLDGSPNGQAYVGLEIRGESQADLISQGEKGLTEPQVRDARSDEKEAELYYLLREEEQVQVQVNTVDVLTAPVEAGTIAGTVTYRLDGEIIKSYNLVTTESVELRDFYWYLQYIWDIFLLDAR